MANKNGYGPGQMDADDWQLVGDMLGSTEVPLVSQAGDLLSAGISAADGDYAMAGLSVAAALAPGLSQIKLSRTIIKLEKHHVIPKAEYKRFLEDFKRIGFKIDDVTDNIKILPKPFHGNHPAYSRRVRQGIQRLIDRGEFGIESIQEFQKTLKEEIGGALNDGWERMNHYYKSQGY